MDTSTREMVEDAYFETTAEAMSREINKLEAHKEGITAAAMLLSAMNGIEHEEAKTVIVELNLRPDMH